MEPGSGERIGPVTNIIDDLSRLLEPRNDVEVDKLFTLLRSNEYVVEAGFKPTKQQFREYFEILKKGFEYMRDNYGAEAVPEHIVLNTGLLTSGDVMLKDWFGYQVDNDSFSVSLVHIAKRCSEFDRQTAFTNSDKLPDGIVVRPKDATLLIPIEEGYHRYQHRVLGMNENTVHESNHPMERAVIPIVRKAVADLGIQTFKVDQNRMVHPCELPLK